MSETPTTTTSQKVVQYTSNLYRIIPQSEILVKFVQETGEKCGKNLAKSFCRFSSISRQNGHKKFHEKSSTFSTVPQIKLFHCCNSGRWGPQGKGNTFSTPPTCIAVLLRKYWWLSCIEQRDWCDCSCDTPL